MPIPLVPILSALAAGGTLVPHAAGGMIVTSAGGYVAGTYLSTAAIAGLLTTASTALGAGALYLSGAASSLIGSSGVFGTTIGASGIKGALMSAGVISSTPAWAPVAIGGAAVSGAAGLGYAGYQLYKLKEKTENARDGEEARFTESEAQIIEGVIKRLGKNKAPSVRYSTLQANQSTCPRCDNKVSIGSRSVKHTKCSHCQTNLVVVENGQGGISLFRAALNEQS